MVIPPKLQKGDMIRVVAPALSMALISEETRTYARQVFENTLGLRVSFGKHVDEVDASNSSSIASRLADLHDAFRDPEVKAVFSIIGGSNSHELLDHIDWELIKANPKVFCGFSDITALQVAMMAKTGLAAYYGPHYSTFGQKQLDAFTVDYFRKCLFSAEPYALRAADTWTDDEWFIDQDARHPIKNEGHWCLQSGTGEGTIIGGNLFTLNRLLGTEFMARAEKAILIIEDDSEVSLATFNQDLEMLLQSGCFKKLAGVVIGRFQQASNVTRERLASALKDKPQLAGIPIVANVDFGHTDPKITWPLGGIARLHCTEKTIDITVVRH